MTTRGKEKVSQTLLRRTLRGTASVAVAQIVTASFALPFVLATLPLEAWPRRALLFAHVLTYGGAGVLLYFIVPAEPRARTLGLLLLCTATVFAAGSIREAEELNGTLLAPLVVVFAVKVDALTPYVAWRFASDFPHVPDSRRGRQRMALARAVSLGVSIALVAANLLAAWLGTADGALAFLARSGRRSLYFQIQYVLALCAFAVLVARARRASLDECRRVSLLVGGLVLGVTPTIVWILLWTLIPQFGERVPLRNAGWVIYPALLAMPVIAGYAVVARKALGVALLFRRAVEHALSRYAVLVLVSAPAVVLILELYRHREDRLVDMLSPSHGWLALLLVAVAAIGLRSQRDVLERIDRAFFRERYDARHVTAQLVDDCRWVATRGELATLLSRGLDQAMHLEHVRLFLLDNERGQFAPASGRGHGLAIDSALTSVIAAAEDGLDIDPDETSPRAAAASEAAWLTDADIRHLVPLHDADTNLLGFLALGPKRSGLPISHDDRDLLKSVARAAELTIAYHRLCERREGSEEISQDIEQITLECVSCGLVVLTAAERCPACTGSLTECVLPAVVGGGLQVAARVGGGGMGMVYRAVDTDLGRSVALKTLPYLSPDAAARLRREAHIMASVSHEAVASIYGVQSWKGKPIIVYEFLPEGTLADRITRGPMTASDVMSIGIAIASGLSAIHDAGLLHGDIKPSNIGFTSNGRPKLLDFGVAVPIQSLGARPEDPSQAGTLAYLAPDVARGGTATFDSDVWSLALTLYEALTGAQPMIGDGFPETIRHVCAGNVPLASTFLPDVRADVESLFETAFARDTRRRFTTAAQLRAALSDIQERVTISP